MPPEYLSRAEAEKRFLELERSMGKMAVENATRDGEIERSISGIEDIKNMLKDRSQMWLTIGIFTVGQLITIGIAVWAKGSN